MSASAAHVTVAARLRSSVDVRARLGSSVDAHYRPDIDGLRALAIVPVILFHARIGGFGGGFVGVDVFFVVSGFLITSLIAPEMARGTFSYLTFWERRARRLLPAMFLVVAASTFVAYWVLVPHELEKLGRSIASVVLFSSNFYFWLDTGYFEIASTTSAPLLHTWSLSVEEQFYLLFPAVLWLTFASRRARPLTVVASIGLTSFAISIGLTYAAPDAAYYLLPSRAWELMLGAFLALQRRDRGCAASPMLADGCLLIGLAFVLVPVFVYGEGTPFPGVAALVPCLGAALLIRFGEEPSSRLRKILVHRSMVFVGKLSYSLYLWHWPLIVFASMALPHRFTPKQTIVLLGATFVCAWLSYALVEDPIRRRRILPTRRGLFTALALGAGALATAAYVTIATRGFEDRLPPDALRVAAAERDMPDWTRCKVAFEHEIAPKELCPLGTPAAATRFLLWGDSHAMVLFPAVDAAAKQIGIAGLHASLNQCPPVLDVDLDTPHEIRCARFNRRVVELIDAQRIEAVVMVARWSSYRRPGFVRVPALSEQTSDEFLLSRLETTMRVLSAKGVRVFFVDEVPWTNNYSPARFSRALWWGRTTEPPVLPVQAYDSRLQPFVRAVAQTGATRIPLAGQLCPDGISCPAIMRGESIYFDDHHLTSRAARALSPALVEAFRSLQP